MNRQFDIAIVGGGVSGLSTALAITSAFAEANLQLPAMVLIDAGDLPSTTVAQAQDDVSVDSFDPRVVALTEVNCQALEQWGVWPAIASVGAGDYQRMTVWDGEGTASINFAAADVGVEKLGAVVENSVLLAALYQQLQNLAVCHCRYGVGVESIERLPSQGVSLQLEDGSTIQTGLVVGADGAKSVVKSLAGYASREWDYQQDAIVCTVKTARSHEQTAWQCFTRHGPLAFLPVARMSSNDDHYCSIVWSLAREEAQKLMACSSRDFMAKMQLAFESRLGNIEEISKRYSFQLWQRHTTQYVKESTVLVGDAAHTLHPLAGQGINMGLKDARSLAAALVKSTIKRKPITNLPMLRRYERERLSENLAMMATVECFKRLYSPGSSSLQLLRNRGMAAVNTRPTFKKQIIKAAVGL